MADTTSLNDLPTDPVSGGGEQNVVLQTSEKSNQYDPNSAAPTVGSEITDQKMMNEVVTGIQQANVLILFILLMKQFNPIMFLKKNKKIIFKIQILNKKF